MEDSRFLEALVGPLELGLPSQLLELADLEHERRDVETGLEEEVEGEVRQLVPAAAHPGRDDGEDVEFGVFVAFAPRAGAEEAELQERLPETFPRAFCETPEHVAFGGRERRRRERRRRRGARGLGGGRRGRRGSGRRHGLVEVPESWKPRTVLGRSLREAAEAVKAGAFDAGRRRGREGRRKGGDPGGRPG